jgi:hypothetical protein
MFYNMVKRKSEDEHLLLLLPLPVLYAMDQQLQATAD